MFLFKGTFIRPNMNTQSCCIQRVYTIWDPILFTIVLTLQFMYQLLADVFKIYMCNKPLSVK